MSRQTLKEIVKLALLQAFLLKKKGKCRDAKKRQLLSWFIGKQNKVWTVGHKFDTKWCVLVLKP